MRVKSVAEIKENSVRTNPLPGEGTHIRAVYDLLYEFRGTSVEISGGTKKHNSMKTSALNQLKIFYGCEIIQTGRNMYCLAGEWIGSYYADYRKEKP